MSKIVTWPEYDDDADVDEVEKQHRGGRLIRSTTRFSVIKTMTSHKCTDSFERGRDYDT